MLATLVLLGTGAVAHAQQAAKPKASSQTTFTSRETLPARDPLAPAGVRKTLQWDSKTGKWGLRLDVDQAPSRESRLKEAEVGAFYRVTPSLRVGGAVGVTNPASIKPQEETNAPRVRVETAFKF